MLVSFHKVAVDIIELWNEEFYFIEQNAHTESVNSSIDRVRFEFQAETLKTSWWSDEKSFDNLPHEFFMNQDFALFAVKIANFVNGEVIHGKETRIKTIKKDFLNDFIRGIEHLMDKNDSEIAIKNIFKAGNKFIG